MHNTNRLGETDCSFDVEICGRVTIVNIGYKKKEMLVDGLPLFPHQPSLFFPEESEGFPFSFESLFLRLPLTRIIWA